MLFLAHRHELLAQAATTFHRLLSAEGQSSHVGWCAGDLLEPEPLVVVSSVQKLARPENLQRVLAAPPDYVIVDEVHHADAPTYRRVLDALDPAFLLGLTATPDRADDGDVLALFDDFIAYRADLGIARGRLVTAPQSPHSCRLTKPAPRQFRVNAYGSVCYSNWGVAVDGSSLRTESANADDLAVSGAGRSQHSV